MKYCHVTTPVTKVAIHKRRSFQTVMSRNRNISLHACQHDEYTCKSIDTERTEKLAVGLVSYSDSLLSRSVHDMGYALIMVALYVVITVVFMMVQVGQGFLDAFLSAVTTASTAGCGDVTDLSQMERLVSTFLVILGVGVAGGAIAIFFNSLNQVDQYAATRQLMRKNQSRGMSTAVIPPSLNQLSFYERSAVRYYKVTSAYYKGKKKLTRFVLSRGWFRTRLSKHDGEVEQSMKGELDEFFAHQLLDLVFFLLLLLLLISLSAGIMVHVEEWNYIDAFYWSVTTISTGGIEQFTVQTSGGKGWMIVYIILGSTTFFSAWFKILYIPIASSEKRTQLAVLNQFSGQLSYETVHKLMHNDFFENIPDLKTDSEEIQKGEFVLMVMFLMNKINYNDVKLGLKVFESLDRISAGAPMSGLTLDPEAMALALSTAPPQEKTPFDPTPPPSPPSSPLPPSPSPRACEQVTGSLTTALNESDILLAMISQFAISVENSTSAGVTSSPVHAAALPQQGQPQAPATRGRRHTTADDSSPSDKLKLIHKV